MGEMVRFWRRGGVGCLLLMILLFAANVFAESVEEGATPATEGASGTSEFQSRPRIHRGWRDH